MAFEIRSEILAQISKTQDENLRIVLLLLLGVLEANAEAIVQVGKKIDLLMKDEEALRRTVLNGLAGTHDDDHLWIAEHKLLTHETMPLIERAQPIIDWAEQKMREEREADESRKSFMRKIMEGAASQIGTIAITAAATWFAVHYLQ